MTLEPGEKDLAGLMADAGKGLLVTSMFGPSLNPNTGDWSVGVSGFWFENGKIVYPVSEVTVAGNMIDLYGRMIPGSDLEIPRLDQRTVAFWSRRWRSPGHDATRPVLFGTRLTRPAALALELRAEGLEIDYKPGGSPVTNADLAVDDLLRTVAAARPDYGWLSEETADKPERLGKAPVPRRSHRRHPAYPEGSPWWSVCHRRR